MKKTTTTTTTKRAAAPAPNPAPAAKTTKYGQAACRVTDCNEPPIGALGLCAKHREDARELLAPAKPAPAVATDAKPVSKSKAAQQRKAEERAQRDIASAAAYAKKHGLDTPNGRDVQPEEVAAGRTLTQTELAAARKPPIGQVKKAAPLQLAQPTGTKTRAAKSTKIRGVDWAAQQAAKEAAAKPAAKKAGAAKPAAKTAHAAPMDGLCAKCGRKNSHGGDCRTAAACAARVKEAKEATKGARA